MFLLIRKCHFNAVFFVLLLICYNKLDARSISEGTGYPQFCQLAANDEEVFKDFKRNPTYNEILEHVSYELGLQYLNIILTEYPELTSYFEKFRENDLLGNPNTFYYENAGYFSPTTLRYIKIAGDLKKQFGDLSNKHVVEIGGGYGGQCKILAELCGFASYTIIDLPECNALAQKYLNRLGVEKVSFLNSDQIANASRYDLVISNYAFSEIDYAEQKNYLEHVINPTPNGYMILNFISQHFNLHSMSIEKLLRVLFDQGRKGKVEAERPISHPNNCLLTWKTEKKTLKNKPTLRGLQSSTQFQNDNAITYSLSGGRLGDNLLAYLHAKWLTYKYGLPLIYKPFPYSNAFCLHQMEQHKENEFHFQNVVVISNEGEINMEPSSTLFVCPYFPESKNECKWFQSLPCLFEVDWEDTEFKKQVHSCLKPMHLFPEPGMLQDFMSVAVHVRRSEEAKYFRSIFPLKFVADDYFIEQIDRISKIFPEKKLYVYVFTDDSNPWKIVSQFSKALNNPNIVFGCKTSPVSNLLEDFFAIPKFDCCIITQSNFSVVASKLGKYSLLFEPINCSFVNGAQKIDEVRISFCGKKLL